MVLRLVLEELLGGFLALPVWWYTRGLSIMLDWFRSTVHNASQMFALGVWMKNLLVPMYGETEWSGRVISFFLRVVMVVVRGFAVVVWTAVAAVLFALYLIALPAAVIGTVFSVVGMIFL